MKTMKKFLSMAALALVGAVMTGCSSDDDSTISNPQQPENKNNVVTLTTTVGLEDGAATTRALTSGGVKTFAANETMALVYKNKSGNTVKAVSAALTAGDISGTGENLNKTATFTFTLEDPDKTQNVTYIYPAAMAGETDVNYAALNSQDGTLSTLSSNLDLATFSGAWDGASLPSATLTNQLAILAITLKNSDGSSDITSDITGMTLSDGTNNYAVTRSAAAGPIYVAIRPTASAAINITATDGSNNYTKSLTGKTYEVNNGYNVSWRMAEEAPTGKTINLSTIYDDLLAMNGDMLTGTLGENHKISIAAGATVTLDNASINANGAWSSGSYAGITCLGDATIILKDGTTNTVKGFSSFYPGIYVPEGSTLTIQGTASLTASSRGDAAGIGGGYNIPCGNIDIQSGTITTTGGNWAAGIGSGYRSSCGTITISSGTVNATGGSYAAGIGSGNGSIATCGNITISGGTVTATGGERGAGIGSGDHNSCGTIIINGGTVNATGRDWSAGIGGGNGGSCGDITITSGVTSVTAKKGTSAPNSIGKGMSGSCGTVNIGGTVYYQNNAYVGDGATYLTTSPLVYTPAP